MLVLIRWISSVVCLYIAVYCAACLPAMPPPAPRPFTHWFFSFLLHCISCSLSLVSWLLVYPIGYCWIEVDGVFVFHFNSKRASFFFFSFRFLHWFNCKVKLLRCAVQLVFFCLFVHRSWVISCIDDSWTTQQFCTYISSIRLWFFLIFFFEKTWIENYQGHPVVGNLRSYALRFLVFLFSSLVIYCLLIECFVGR